MTGSLMHPVRHVVRVTLEAVTPISIGSGETDATLDAPLFRDWNGLPCLSGAAIAGVLRSLHEDHYGKSETCALFGHQTPGTDSGLASGLLVSFGLVMGKDGRAVDRRLTASQIAADTVLSLLAEPDPILRDHVAIDAATGAAKDTGKFDRAACPVGARFALELAIDGDDAKGDRLFEVVRLLDSPMLRLGGGGRRGAGRFKVHRRRYAKIDRGGPGGRSRWLAYRQASLDAEPTAHRLEWDKPRLRPLPPNGRGVVTGTLELQAQGAWRMGTGRKPWGEVAKADKSPLLEPVILWPGPGQAGEARVERNRTPVPGSGVKGALAHRTEFHLRRLRRCFGPGTDARLSDELFGSVNSKTGGKAGAVMIDDVVLDYSGVDEKLRTREQTRNSIDRHLGGVRKGALFTDQALWRGPEAGEPTLRLSVTLQEAGFPLDVLRAFDWALEDLCAGRLALGAGDAIGDGVFTGEMKWDDGRERRVLPAILRADPAEAA